MSDDEETFFNRADQNKKEEALRILAPKGVVRITQQFDEVTFHYADGETWTKTERELLSPHKGKRVIDFIPDRPESLH